MIIRISEIFLLTTTKLFKLEDQRNEKDIRIVVVYLWSQKTQLQNCIVDRVCW